MNTEEIKIGVDSCSNGWFMCTFKTKSSAYGLECTSLWSDPSQDILAWLKEILIDDNIEKKSLKIDSETGSCTIVRLEKLSEGYSLTVGNEELHYFKVTVNKYQFIQAFYTAVVDFYHSDSYDREANEAKYIYEVFYEKFGFDILSEKSIRYMLTRNKVDLENLLHGIGNEPLIPKNVSFPRQCHHIIKKARENFQEYEMSDLAFWDYSDSEFSSEEEKLRAIKQAVHSNVKNSYANFRLQEFYSEEIEEYLLEGGSKYSSGHDHIHFDYTVADELRVNAYINGVELFKNEGIGFDIREMIRSLKKDGAYALYVCSGCGDEGCGGIFESPNVTTCKGMVTWSIYELKPYTFRFKKAQILSAFEILKAKMLKEKTLEAWENTSMYFNRVDFLGDMP